jgi:hypothetical protein
MLDMLCFDFVSAAFFGPQTCRGSAAAHGAVTGPRALPRANQPRPFHHRHRAHPREFYDAA